MKRLVASIILAVFMTLSFGACAPPETVMAPPGETAPVPTSPTPEKPATGIIKDLAYVKGMVSGYSDDADPEDEGVRIIFLWYDTKSKMIFFSNIPISVAIELYPYGYAFKAYEDMLGRCIYKGKVQINSSASEIRIPFEEIDAIPTKEPGYGSLAKVTIHTPQQGDYSIEVTSSEGFETK